MQRFRRTRRIFDGVGAAVGTCGVATRPHTTRFSGGACFCLVGKRVPRFRTMVNPRRSLEPVSTLHLGNVIPPRPRCGPNLVSREGLEVHIDARCQDMFPRIVEADLRGGGHDGSGYRRLN
jgi:hypothetical protein